MSYTLVVIDMQPHFDAANDLSVVVGCANQILQAKLTNNNIMFVEYSLCGSTHQELKDIVKRYPRVAKVSKNQDDGSIEILNALRRKNWSVKNIRVCGVNTECCVWVTVQGLLHRSTASKIEVVKNACATWSTDKFDWRTYLRHRNLKLV